MQKLKKCPKYVKNLFKHKKLEYYFGHNKYDNLSLAALRAI